MEKSRKRFRTIWVILSWLIILLIMSVNPCIGAEDPAKFPSKPITMIIPWPPGGTTDMAIRKLSDLASKTLGQPILIENKGGGSGVIGINAISKATNDGYTIGNMTHSPIVVVPHMRSVPYNPIEDFTFIMQYGEFMHAFCVLSTSPWKTLKETGVSI